MYCWSELRALLEKHDCDIVTASASNFWLFKMRMRCGSRIPVRDFGKHSYSGKRLCQEEALDGGTHIIAVLCKRD